MTFVAACVTVGLINRVFPPDRLSWSAIWAGTVGTAVAIAVLSGGYTMFVNVGADFETHDASVFHAKANGAVSHVPRHPLRAFSVTGCRRRPLELDGRLVPGQQDGVGQVEPHCQQDHAATPPNARSSSLSVRTAVTAPLSMRSTSTR